VHIFDQETWASISLPGRPEVAVTGAAYQRPLLVEERRLAERIPRPETAVSLLLLHGSRDGFAPTGKRITLPFSESELLDQGFTYAALGHYHEHSTVHDGSGSIRAAYAGCPQGRGLDEVGEKGALVITLDSEGVQELELVPTAERVLHRLPVDLGRITEIDEILSRVEELITACGARERDFVVAEISGRMPPGLELDLPSDPLAGRVAHLEIVTAGLRPDYDFEAYRSGEAPPSTETRFARRLLDAIEAAADPEEEALLREALDLGLDALNGHGITYR
jgi:DNA repair exonuclease SbcCD nuclease subunit